MSLVFRCFNRLEFRWTPAASSCRSMLQRLAQPQYSRNVKQQLAPMSLVEDDRDPNSKVDLKKKKKGTSEIFWVSVAIKKKWWSRCLKFGAAKLSSSTAGWEIIKLECLGNLWPLNVPLCPQQDAVWWSSEPTASEALRELTRGRGERMLITAFIQLLHPSKEKKKHLFFVISSSKKKQKQDSDREVAIALWGKKQLSQCAVHNNQCV